MVSTITMPVQKQTQQESLSMLNIDMHNFHSHFGYVCYVKEHNSGDQATCIFIILFISLTLMELCGVYEI
jgi:hypothetical protein